MSEQLQGRIVNVGGDEIAIYDIDQPGSWFTEIYQNKDTKALDETFGLTGEPIEVDSDVAHFLSLATDSCSLGETEVELVLRYFAGLAKQVGNFVGVPEQELRKNISDGKLRHFDGSDVNRALTYRDGMANGETYLKRINVEGKDVLFPANLRKQYI